jgi:hypothetical protein
MNGVLRLGVEIATLLTLVLTLVLALVLVHRSRKRWTVDSVCQIA